MRVSLIWGTLSWSSLWDRTRWLCPMGRQKCASDAWATGWARGTTPGGISVLLGGALGEHRKSLLLRTVLGNTII